MSRRCRLAVRAELDASVRCSPACWSDAVQQPNTSAVEILISGFLESFHIDAPLAASVEYSCKQDDIKCLDDCEVLLTFFKKIN